MIICDSKRYTFVNTFRNANVSIEDALFDDVLEYRGEYRPNTHKGEILRYYCPHFARPMSMGISQLVWFYQRLNWIEDREDESRDLGWESLYKNFVFTFVRNPWEWMPAAYFAMREDLYNVEHGMAMKFGFSDWLRWRAEGNVGGLPKQTALIEYCPGWWVPHFVGKVENLQTDFDYVCDRIGIQRRVLRKLNVAKEPVNLSELYDEAAINLVKTELAEEFRVLGYSKEMPC